MFHWIPKISIGSSSSSLSDFARKVENSCNGIYGYEITGKPWDGGCWEIGFLLRDKQTVVLLGHNFTGTFKLTAPIKGRDK